MVRFATCLTGWKNSFWLLFSSVTVFVAVVNVNLVCVVVWDRVIGVLCPEPRGRWSEEDRRHNMAAEYAESRIANFRKKSRAGKYEISLQNSVR